jgi:hypothetical protein
LVPRGEEGHDRFGHRPPLTDVYHLTVTSPYMRS